MLVSTKTMHPPVWHIKMLTIAQVFLGLHTLKGHSKMCHLISKEDIYQALNYGLHMMGAKDILSLNLLGEI